MGARPGDVWAFDGWLRCGILRVFEVGQHSRIAVVIIGMSSANDMQLASLLDGHVLHGVQVRPDERQGGPSVPTRCVGEGRQPGRDEDVDGVFGPGAQDGRFLRGAGVGLKYRIRILRRRVERKLERTIQ